MSQAGRKTQSKKGSQKGARSKSGGKAIPKSKTPEAQITLLDPPQIAKAIHQYFRAQPAKGDQLWSEIQGNDNLLGGWYTYVQASRTEEFWTPDYWLSGIHLFDGEWRALRAMWDDPRHMMAVCRTPSVLTAVCELFDVMGSLPSNRGLLFARLVDALLSREEAICRATGAAWVGPDIIKHTLAGLAYEMKARLLFPYKQVQALVSSDTTRPDELITVAASASLLLVDKTVRFTDLAFQAYFASEKLGEIMDSGLSAVEFLPPDNWQVHRAWQEALVMLAGNRDPVRVASWIAETNPLIAGRCLTDSGHNLSLQEIDVATLDLGEIAYRWFNANSDSGVRVGHIFGSRAGLASLIARTAHSEHPASMKRLTSILDPYVPEALLPVTYDWFRVISDQDLPGFFEGLSRSETDLHLYAKQHDGLKPDRRRKPLILHVDDDSSICSLTKMMVSQAFGEQILLTSTDFPPTALILASVLLPDLVLTDVSNVGLDGFTFAEYLRKNPVTQDVPFVFVTAHVQPSDIVQGIWLDARKYITKPFLPSHLVATIQDVLGIEAKHPGL